MNSYKIVIFGLILVNFLISERGIKDTYFFNKYKFNIGTIRKGEYFRFISSGFLHADWQHFIFNMITLYLFADFVIFHTGIFHFLVLYGVSLLLGGLLSYAFYKNNPYYSAVGASGAITGVVYSGILLEPQLHIWFMPAPIFGVVYLLYSIYGMKSQNDTIGHSAHFGGAIGGYFYTLAQNLQLIYTQPMVLLALAIPIVLLFILFYFRKI